MKRKCKELKQISRGNLCGVYGTFIVAMLLTSLIPFIALSPFSSAMNKDMLQNKFQLSTVLTYIVAAILVTLFLSILQAGKIKLHLNLARKSPFRLGDLFSQFVKRPDRFIFATLLLLLISCAILVPDRKSVV